MNKTKHKPPIQFCGQNEIRTQLVNEQKSFRYQLIQLFATHKERNPNFSLRAFARRLDVESSYLSKILRGTRPVNKTLVKKIGRRLNWPDERIKRQIREDESIIARNARSSAPYKKVSKEAFATIEDWRHYAILELMKLNDFQPSTQWLGKALGMKSSEVDPYLSRLVKAGLLEINENGEWHDLSSGNCTHVLRQSEYSEAHVRSQLNLLEMSADALRTRSLRERDHSSMMMATNKAKITEAKKRIAKFRRELSTFLEKSSNKNAVFQLTIGLFPISEV